MRNRFYYQLYFGITYNSLRITDNNNKYIAVSNVKIECKVPETTKYHQSRHRIKNETIIAMIKSGMYKSNMNIFDIAIREDFKNAFWEKHSIIIKYI